MVSKKKSLLLLSAIFTAIVLSGCAGQKTRFKSSVVDYLYPTNSETVEKPSIPVLSLPIKVGIAFVPGQRKTSGGFNFWHRTITADGLTESKKTELLDKVAKHFKKYDFVSDIEVIPSDYLTPGGSFTNLEQIKTMYGVDVVALVSYDQIQFTDRGLLSFTYWTIVGAYVVSGDKNDTSTLMDTVVYDINSRKLLFRAPGTSDVKGSATPVNLSEELRADSIKGFELSTEKMIANLDMQLERFKEKIKERPEQIKIVHKKGYSGSGAFSWLEIFICVLIVLFGLIKKQRTV